MIVVEIFSKQDCHLCDRAKEVLLRVQKKHPFDLRTIMLDEQHPQYEQFKERIPVIVMNGNVAFQFKVHEKEFIERLMQAGASR